MKKPPPPKTHIKLPAKKQPKQPKGKHHHHVHHLTAAQAKRRQQARIKTLRHQLHLARHPAPPAKKKPKARKPRALSDGTPCVAAAVAAALGLPDEVVLPFCPDEALIGDVLEDLAGVVPVTFWPADPQDATAGTVLGLALPEGPHAAVYAGGGLMWSWDRLMPVYGAVEEAWAVTWWARSCTTSASTPSTAPGTPFGRVPGPTWRT